MKIRTSSSLMAHLDDEMAWRLKELHELRSAVESAKGKNIDAHIRAGLSMLYAHWEGYVRSAANSYISYVAHRGDRNDRLMPCFVALGMKSSLGTFEETGKAPKAVAFVNFFLAQMDKPANLPKADGISTESNLSSAVFANIASWIGIDISRYAARFNLIDESLLKSRNGIAHGEYLSVTQERFHILMTEILELMRWFKTDIQNAAATEAFLLSKAA